MNLLLFSSQIGGFFSLVLLFLISVITVLFFKAVKFFIKNLSITVKVKETKPKKPRQPIKSIVINPEEVNRIYVKKD